ncbi:unnamed protein product [Arctogadus glacialis]
MQAGDWQIGSVLDSNAFSRDPTPPTRLAAAAMKDDGGENDEAKDGLGCGGGGGGGRGGVGTKRYPLYTLLPIPNSSLLLSCSSCLLFFFHPGGFSCWLISPEILLIVSVTLINKANFVVVISRLNA